MKPILPLLFGVLLIGTVSACTESKTAFDAPTTDNNEQVSTTENLQSTQDDAESATRRSQLDADIRAREERNDMVGDSEVRNDADLASEVRSKLEANIPRGKLTVIAKDADITVSGVVATQNELDKIQPLAMEIKGVNNVMVEAVVKP
ncbi:MAG: BON domain-containing protein [Gloeocapsa sp. DLM2.Bin57]|nr:MAG: BON domain-containing protein [Gloeocapsa sp. DLM2.Bin57]